jgi:hypothetical protein
MLEENINVYHNLKTLWHPMMRYKKTFNDWVDPWFLSLSRDSLFSFRDSFHFVKTVPLLYFKKKDSFSIQWFPPWFSLRFASSRGLLA